MELIKSCSSVTLCRMFCYYTDTITVISSHQILLLRPVVSLEWPIPIGVTKLLCGHLRLLTKHMGEIVWQSSSHDRIGSTAPWGSAFLMKKPLYCCSSRSHHLRQGGGVVIIFKGSCRSFPVIHDGYTESVKMLECCESRYESEIVCA